MSERRWLAELDEHDRDLYEAELAYDNWLERDVVAYRFNPNGGYLLDADDDGYDPNDPYDRLKSEGGHLSE